MSIRVVTEKVGGCGFSFRPDELEGFECATFPLPPEDDGELCATLIRTVGPEHDNRPAVLYVHGFVDYFFQTHLAQAFEDAGFRFYALDLRRYGRSLRKGNRPNLAASLDDYFEELTQAIACVSHWHPRIAAIVAHSTGGLISSLYMHRGELKNRVGALVLNSPFFRFALGSWDMTKAKLVAKVARFAPNTRLPDKINNVYGRTLHVSQQGEWDYDLTKKPIEGFPLYAGWFRMIRRGQKEVSDRLDIQAPVLALCSSRSRTSGKEPVPEDFTSDTVLDVKDMRTLSPGLGPHVTLAVVEDGLHDLTLSPKHAREFAVKSMVDFVLQADQIAQDPTSAPSHPRSADS